jgi:hypothetical protein
MHVASPIVVTVVRDVVFAAVHTDSVNAVRVLRKVGPGFFIESRVIGLGLWANDQLRNISIERCLVQSLHDSVESTFELYPGQVLHFLEVLEDGHQCVEHLGKRGLKLRLLAWIAMHVALHVFAGCLVARIQVHVFEDFYLFVDCDLDHGVPQILISGHSEQDFETLGGGSRSLYIGKLSLCRPCIIEDVLGNFLDDFR